MSIVVILGGAVPFIEMSIALGLLTKTYRKLAFIAAVSLHAIYHCICVYTAQLESCYNTVEYGNDGYAAFAFP
jgi:hypothetical protein